MQLSLSDIRNNFAFRGLVSLQHDFGTQVISKRFLAYPPDPAAVQVMEESNY